MLTGLPAPAVATHLSSMNDSLYKPGWRHWLPALHPRQPAAAPPLSPIYISQSTLSRRGSRLKPQAGGQSHPVTKCTQGKGLHRCGQPSGEHTGFCNPFSQAPPFRPRHPTGHRQTLTFPPGPSAHWSWDKQGRCMTEKRIKRNVDRRGGSIQIRCFF